MEDAEKSGAADGERLERRRARRWVVVGLAVVVIAPIVFALEQAGGSGSGPLDAIAKAAEATQREAGGHALIHATVTVSDTPEGVTETGSMVFEDGGRARGTLAVRGHSTGRRAKVQVIVDGTTSYTSSDQFGSLPEGRKWVKVALSSTDSSSSLPADGGPQEGLKLLEQMDGAEEIGKEDIRGAATTRYRGTLPVSGKEVLGVEVQVSPPQIEVWIDARDRVRRMTVVISGSVKGEEGSTTTDMTIDFLDFGPVSKIGLPKQNEIYDATSRVESNLRSSAEAP
ncbi:MAG TPA: LppX_LprAFG lipoprotein [Solirubrobacterales bacterium]|nr:LppX_LprAFG lipoprotein [Solirubrobacterales bacterium]